MLTTGKRRCCILLFFISSKNSDVKSEWIACVKCTALSQSFLYDACIQSKGNICNNLISVTLPNSLTRIGGNAFAYNKLTSVSLSNSLPDFDFTSVAWQNEHSDNFGMFGPTLLTQTCLRQIIEATDQVTLTLRSSLSRTKHQQTNVAALSWRMRTTSIEEFQA